MLYLIGLAIGDEKDISVKGLEACKKCDEIYCELYTCMWTGSISKLEKMIGKKITVSDREEIEEPDEIMRKAKKKNIAILVPGDPLTATTHLTFLVDCKDEKVPFQVIHSSSVYTAVARTGLQLYKFGRTGTVARSIGRYKPISFYDCLVDNQKSGFHTLFLLDKDMGSREGLQILVKIDKEKGLKLLGNRKIIVCSKLGTNKEKIVYGKVKDLLKKDLDPPAAIIVPGKLHFTEEEFLDAL